VAVLEVNLCRRGSATRMMNRAITAHMATLTRNAPALPSRGQGILFSQMPRTLLLPAIAPNTGVTSSCTDRTSEKVEFPSFNWRISNTTSKESVVACISRAVETAMIKDLDSPGSSSMKDWSNSIEYSLSLGRTQDGMMR